jgi:hypothetical protein
MIFLMCRMAMIWFMKKITPILQIKKITVQTIKSLTRRTVLLGF